MLGLKQTIISGFSMEWMDRAWSGEERLGRVFWKYGVLYLALIIVGTSIISGVRSVSLALKATPPSSSTGQNSVLWIMCCLSLLSLYSIWWVLTVWKCRNETEGKFWKYPAIIVASVWAVGSTFNLAESYIHREDIPLVLNQVAFDACAKLMGTYAEKYHVDQIEYMKQNRDYLNKCVESYSTQPKAK
jgi:hypothetical protein